MGRGFGNSVLQQNAYDIKNKNTVYEKMIRPVLLYRAETWALRRSGWREWR